MLGDRPAIAATLQEAGVPIGDLELALEAAKTKSQQLDQKSSEVAHNLRDLIDRVRLESRGIRVSLNLKRLIAEPIDTEDLASLTMNRLIPMEIKRRGVELRLVIEGENQHASRPDPSLLKAIARGHRWFDELASGRAASIREIAQREGLFDSYVKRLIPLAFLAPEIVRSISEGSQPSTLTAEVLKRNAPLPLDDRDRRRGAQ